MNDSIHKGLSKPKKWDATIGIEILAVLVSYETFDKRIGILWYIPQNATHIINVRHFVEYASKIRILFFIGFIWCIQS
jgi:hypothetical protein